MEEGYELDLTYVTERIIAVSFPRACSEEIYLHNLKDVTRMLKSKHADNYLIINLSEKRHDLSKMNPKTLDTGWPDLHAPPLDKICTICKAMEGWLNADPLHVVVIHCRGGKGRIGVVISSFVHFTDISASADQALDRFAMRKYYDDKVSALMTPSQKRYVWILNSLLSGSMKINASPLFLHCIVLHGIPNFHTSGVCRPYLKVYQGMQAVYSSGIYHIGPGHRDRICITLEPAQLLKGDIMVKCYNKSEAGAEREVIFRLQFHTGAVQGFNLMFEKEDMESANKDPRFPDYGKVELVFSEGPEKIPGAERWQNGSDVSVDYNTADPLTRWDSYHNICDGEAPRSRGPLLDRAPGTVKRSPNGGASTPGRGPRAASTTSSPDHSDHALSASSDSGLSSTSLWTERPPTATANATLSSTTSAVAKPNQGPSRQEKAQLKRLLSGFGLEDPSLEEMADHGPGGGGAQQRLVPAQVHANGDPGRGPRERETDILDDEVLMSGGHHHDLRSADSLGTLSSSCHKSSQNSLLSDGFGGPGGEEPQQPAPPPHAAHHLLQHQPATAAAAAADEYERAYAAARRGCLAGRSASVASSSPASVGAIAAPKQQVYRQGSYSTQTWVRQQQMVAAQQYAYRPEEDEEEEETGGVDGHGYPRDKSGGGATLTKPALLPEPQVATRGYSAEPPVAAATTTLVHNNNNSKRDEEFNSLTTDIDNSIDQLNQLIMDLDPTFVPVPTRSESVRRGSGAGIGGARVNGSAPNGVGRRLAENSAAASAQQTAVQCGDVRAGAMRTLSRQGSEVTDHPGYCGSGWGVAVGVAEEYRSSRTYSPCVPPSQHGMLYRSDSVDYRVQGLDMDSGVEAGSDITPPTPAFPISPPTPYVKNMVEFTHLRQTPSPSMPSYGTYRTEHDPRGYPEMIAHGLSSDEGLPDSSPNCHWSFGAARSASVGGTLHRTESPCTVQSWPEGAPLSRHSSLSGYSAPRHPPAHSVSLDYGRQSPPAPAAQPYPAHPAPNAHSSPRGGQRSRQACYALSHHSPARSYDEQDNASPGYLGHGECAAAAAAASSLLGNGGMERNPHGRAQQPPLLPEKRRASDGEHSLGTASPALSGFSSPHSGSSLSIPFPNVLPDLAPGSAPSPLPDVLASKQLTVKFVQDTSKFWYKPDISRDQAISVLKDKEPGCFIVRDSHSFRGAYGLAMKVATPPPSVLQQSKKGGDLANELVRHFLIECTQKGVRLKGCPNEPYFGSLTALVCQHSITPLALPCKLIIPDRDPLEDVLENTSQSVTNSAAELLKQGAACNVWFLGSVEMESLTGYQAVQKATSVMLGSEAIASSTVVHFKVSSQGITLTDNQRKLFFRRHYAVNTVIFCALDPKDRKWTKDGCTSAKIFGFVARKTGSAMDNVCHLFAEHDPEQPASAIVNFVSKVMIGSQKAK